MVTIAIATIDIEQNKSTPKITHKFTRQKTQRIRVRIQFCLSVDTNRFYRYRVHLLCRKAFSYFLLNLTQFIRFLLERSIKSVPMFSQSQCCLHSRTATFLKRSIKNVLMFSQLQCCLYSRTATGYGLKRPSTQRSKTI